MEVLVYLEEGGRSESTMARVQEYWRRGCVGDVRILSIIGGRVGLI